MSSKSKTTARPNVFHQNRFYSLSAVAYSCAADIKAGDDVIADFLHWAIEGYKEFHFDLGRGIKVVEIEMKPWKQIDFPCDMVDWTLVGFKVGNFLKVLTGDARIPKTFDQEDCVPQENQNYPSINDAPVMDIIPFYPGTGFIGEGSFYPQLYGNKVNYNYLGYFDVDWDKRVINFKQTVPNHTKVYLEYITDGINYDGQTIVPPYCFKCIKNYVHWQRKEHDSRIGLAEKDRAQRLYEKKFDEVAVRQLDLSIDDIREAIWTGYTQSPKS